MGKINIKDLPNEILKKATKKFPDVWRKAEIIRANPPYTFPFRCYMPFDGWAALTSQFYNFRDDIETKIEINRHAYICAGVGPWRYTQGIYRFHPDMSRALRSTPIKGNIPCDVLRRLPEWSVYVEHEYQQFNGFFAFFNYLKSGEDELRFMFLSNDEITPMTIRLGNITIEEASKKYFEDGLKAMDDPNKAFTQRQLDKFNLKVEDFSNDSVFQRSAIKEMVDLLNESLSLLLYICCGEPEYKGGVKPSKPLPKKTKKGDRFFPAKKNKIWKLGYETGEKLARAKKIEAKRAISQKGRKRPETHIRRAHWHGFYKGKKGEERRFVFKWLPPTMINAELYNGED